MPDHTRVLVVLSGGQDSTTALYMAQQQFENVSALTFDYDQRHSIEIDAAIKIAQLAGVGDHEVLEIGPILNGKSPLTDKTGSLETYGSFVEMDKTIGDRVELTFVPMRNALFLTLAANRAACSGIKHIYTGICEADNANYPDTRKVFLQAQTIAVNMALGYTGDDIIQLHAPLMRFSKSESIQHALHLPGCYAALAYSHTSYSGEYPPVTQDHATVLRAHGFEEAGVPDPMIVRAYLERRLDVLPSTDNYRKFTDVIQKMFESGFDQPSCLETLEQHLRTALEDSEV